MKKWCQKQQNNRYSHLFHCTKKITLWYFKIYFSSYFRYSEKNRWNLKEKVFLFKIYYFFNFEFVCKLWLNARHKRNIQCLLIFFSNNFEWIWNLIRWLDNFHGGNLSLSNYTYFVLYVENCWKISIPPSPSKTTFSFNNSFSMHVIENIEKIISFYLFNTCTSFKHFSTEFNARRYHIS